VLRKVSRRQLCAFSTERDLTPSTLQRAAAIVGCKLQVQLVSLQKTAEGA
jgi:hypothetical protein